MKINDLKPNPKNPRDISSAKLSLLKASLHEFGDLSGIVFNRRTKTLVGGHQRVKVLTENADISIEHTFKTPTRTGTVAKGTILIDGEGYVYREVDWDEDKEKAANIAANKHGGEWNLPQLSEWLLELDAKNYDMNLTGFDTKELEDLMAPVHHKEGQCDEDEVPKIPDESRTRLGDTYTLGNHRLLCGDSTSIDAVEKLMNGEKADMVFTDPPYGVGYKYNSHDDNVTKEEHTQFLKDLIGMSLSLSNRFILTPGCYNLDAVIRNSEPTHVGCWTKTNAMSPGRVTHFWTWEPIFFYGKWPRKRGNDVFNFPVGKQPDTGDHTCPKPIALWQEIIENFSEPKDKILDLFGGSGSTLIACEKTNRKCFMMELDPHYCDVIVARWEKFTGKKAKLVDQNRITTEVPDATR